jgi:ankyrin repeat protein
LIEAGADINAIDAAGKAPLHIAAARDMRHDTSGYPDPNQVSEPALRLLEKLIAKGAAIEVGAPTHATPLFDAGSRAADVLLSHGAQVDARSPRDGQSTPLMRAAIAGDGAKIEVLLRHGADHRLMDVSNCDAICHAQRALARYGRQPNERQFGRELARYRGIVDRLVAAGAGGVQD